MSLVKRVRQSAVPNSATARLLKSSVEEVAYKRFLDSGYSALRGVRCDFHEGVLTLRGRVPSYYLKQIAQTLVRTLDRVELIENRLEVVCSTSLDDPASAQPDSCDA